MAWKNKKTHSKYNGERKRVSIALCVVLRHCRAKAPGPFRENNIRQRIISVLKKTILFIFSWMDTKSYKGSHAPFALLYVHTQTHTHTSGL